MGKYLIKEIFGKFQIGMYVGVVIGTLAMSGSLTDMVINTFMAMMGATLATIPFALKRYKK